MLNLAGFACLKLENRDAESGVPPAACSIGWIVTYNCICSNWSREFGNKMGKKQKPYSMVPSVLKFHAFCNSFSCWNSADTGLVKKIDRKSVV